ncbi:hypothetical protein [Hymenobacter bucti]|uniref:Uncharacterized protein n=1 Tax=Hymenobacter bucti TaxID=1844114 RepID=A0ABW4QPF6_9BACT
MTIFQKTAAFAVLSSLALAAEPARAQVNININTAPPVVVGAPANAQYYYIPEANAYYDVPARRYLVQRNGQWARYERLDGYDPRNFHPQYIDYRGDSPWLWKGKGHPHGMPPGQAKKMGYGDDYGKGNGKHKDKDKGHGRH